MGGSYWLVPGKYNSNSLNPAFFPLCFSILFLHEFAEVKEHVKRPRVKHSEYIGGRGFQGWSWTFKETSSLASCCWLLRFTNLCNHLSLSGQHLFKIIERGKDGKKAQHYEYQELCCAREMSPTPNKWDKALLMMATRNCLFQQT